MSPFVASHRKYRPTSFKGVKGNPHISTTLQNAVKNHQLAQAILLCGPKGTGKTSTARILAKAANCYEPTPEGEACGTCQSCLAFQQNTSLNVHELDAASHNSAEDMRQIVDQLQYYPTSGSKITLIVDEAHMLSTAAFNVLLKPLEETPAHVLFILVTTEKHKILPTILSRCQVFDFHPLEPQEITDQLRYVAKKENVKCEEAALEVLSQQAGGSLRDALSLFDLVVAFEGQKQLTHTATLRHLHLLDDDHYFTLTSALYRGEAHQTLTQCHHIMKQGFDGLHIIQGLAHHLRNLLVAQRPETRALLQKNEAQIARYHKEAVQITPSFIYKSLTLVEEAHWHYKTALHPQLHLELLLLKIAQHAPHLENRTAPSLAPPTTTEPPSAPTSREATSEKVSSTPQNQPTKKTPPPSSFTTDKIPFSTQALHRPLKPPHPEPTTTEATKNLRPTPIEDIAQLQSLLEAYRAKLLEAGDKAGYALLQLPYQVEEHKVLFPLPNPLQVQKFKELTPTLLSYLRQGLQNSTLLLAYTAPKEGSPPSPDPYTDDEVLSALIKKYPLVKTLQEKLQLTTP